MEKKSPFKNYHRESSKEDFSAFLWVSLMGTWSEFPVLVRFPFHLDLFFLIRLRRPWSLSSAADFTC